MALAETTFSAGGASALQTVGHTYSPLKGLMQKLGSVFCFAIMCVCIKLLGQRYPTHEIIFFRSTVSLLFILPFIAYVGWKHARPHKFKAHLVRSSIGLFAMYMTFTAVGALPFAIFTTIQFTVPLFVAALAVFVLKERLSSLQWGALILGFIGVLLVVKPTGHFPIAIALVGLFASCLGAVVCITIKQMTKTETSLSILLTYNMTCFLITAVASLVSFRVPTTGDFIILLICSVSGMMGQALMTLCTRYAPISLLSILEYTSLVWALFYGWFFWGEYPTLITLTGAAMIIFCGLYIARNKNVA